MNSSNIMIIPMCHKLYQHSSVSRVCTYVRDYCGQPTAYVQYSHNYLNVD